MTREDVLQALRDHEAELRARGEAGPRSDIGVAIRFAPDAPITPWGDAGLKRRVSGRAGKALLDIRENILLAETWTAGIAPDRFAENRVTFHAVTRCLEIISEARRRLPTELKRRQPAIE